MKRKSKRSLLPYFSILSVIIIIVLLGGFFYVVQRNAGEKALAGEAIGKGTSSVVKQVAGIRQDIITQCQSQIQNCNLATKSELASLQDQIAILNNKLEDSSLSYVKRSDFGGPCSRDGECLGYLQCSNNVCIYKSGGGCFLAGTKTLMADHTYKNIEEIEVDDEVISYNEESGRNTVSKVSNVYVHDTFSEYILINDKLKVTKNHPLYINGEWLEAGSARIGNLLQDVNGNNVKVTSLEEVTEQGIKVYNLGVEGTHTYYVEDILVHNK